ncbi:MAG TPA: CGNR zinc finger domain-containing protein [Actinomycetota bacterium]|nr:CGNR zinc finger domain-containing protein [Actinomycetota bacterium]
MLQVTWAWLGQGPALDLADTVAIVDGAERDLIAAPGDYDRWARLEAAFLPEGSYRLLRGCRAEVLALRDTVRAVIGAIADGGSPPRRAVAELNRASRAAPAWFELDPEALTLQGRSSGRALDRLLAHYARSAIDLVAGHRPNLRRCPAPSCGMFYVRTRAAQRWCSTQCGTRARVARHYRRSR